MYLRCDSRKHWLGVGDGRQGREAADKGCVTCHCEPWSLNSIEKFWNLLQETCLRDISLKRQGSYANSHSSAVEDYMCMCYYVWGQNKRESPGRGAGNKLWEMEVRPAGVWAGHPQPLLPPSRHLWSSLPARWGPWWHEGPGRQRRALVIDDTVPDRLSILLWWVHYHIMMTVTLGLRVITGCFWVFHVCSKLWEPRKSGCFFFPSWKQQKLVGGSDTLAHGMVSCSHV